MTSAAKSTFGTTLSIDGSPIEELLSLTPPEETAKTQNVTSHESEDATEEFIATILNSGKVGGKFNYKGATGQETLRASKGVSPAPEFSIVFPNNGPTLTFDGNLTSWKWSDLPVDGVQQVDFTVEATGPIDVTPAGS